MRTAQRRPHSLFRCRRGIWRGRSRTAGFRRRPWLVHHGERGATDTPIISFRDHVRVLLADQDAIAAVQVELGATCERLATADAAREKLQKRFSAIEAAYAEEQSARQQAERARRDAEVARADVERRLRQLDLAAGGPVERPTRRSARPARAPDIAATKPRVPVRRVKAQPVAATPEPEPVQWWLTGAKKTQRR
jgi:hypothetical protein